MFPDWQPILLQLRRALWIRAGLISLLAVAAAILAPLHRSIRTGRTAHAYRRPFGGNAACGGPGQEPASNAAGGAVAEAPDFTPR